MRPILLLLPALLAHASGEEPRLNQLQAIGSHKSCHVAPPDGLLGTLKKFNKDAEAWN